MNNIVSKESVKTKDRVDVLKDAALAIVVPMMIVILQISFSIEQYCQYMYVHAMRQDILCA